MDEERARTALSQVARELPGRVVLWREFVPSEDDADLVVARGAEADLRRVLERAGLSPDHRHTGRFMWETGGMRLDVREAVAWPAYYPSLEGVIERAASQDELPPLASREDRLLIMAADAVYGRELGTLVSRSRALLQRPGAEERVAELARAEGFEGLLALATHPEQLAAQGRRGRLPYPRAGALALRSAPARKALAARIAKLVQLGMGRVVKRRLGR